MRPKSYPTAPCLVCGREMRLLKNGTIGHHAGRRHGRYRDYRCAGVGKPPRPDQQALTEAESVRAQCDTLLADTHKQPGPARRTT